MTWNILLSENTNYKNDNNNYYITNNIKHNFHDKI